MKKKYNRWKDLGQLPIDSVTDALFTLYMSCLYDSQYLLTQAGSRECETHYVHERKLPSKWAWLSPQTSAAHRALHCSPSMGLSSQAAVTALLLPASLTDVPETYPFTAYAS